MLYTVMQATSVPLADFFQFTQNFSNRGVTALQAVGYLIAVVAVIAVSCTRGFKLWKLFVGLLTGAIIAWAVSGGVDWGKNQLDETVKNTGDQAAAVQVVQVPDHHTLV